MAVELYTQPEVHTENPRYKLSLVGNEDGGFTVNAENDNDGTTFSLLTFNQDGTVTRHGYIDTDSGFKLDKLGRIVEKKEE